MMILYEFPAAAGTVVASGLTRRIAFRHPTRAGIMRLWCGFLTCIVAMDSRYLGQGYFLSERSADAWLKTVYPSAMVDLRDCETGDVIHDVEPWLKGLAML